MSFIFSHCESLTSIDLSSFNTENVINMRGLFFYCLKLEEVNVSKFNTSNVKDMSGMFNFCQKLLYIDVSSFDMKNVINMQGMFLSMNVIHSPTFPIFDPDNIQLIKVPIKVKVNENSYNKFLQVLSKEILYK